MAIDQNAILQLLTQLQGGGYSPSAPISGIGGGTPLSGLALGEQGMGLGGGGSLLGGGGSLGGGEAGPGLDLLSLMNQLSVGEVGGGQRTLGQQFPIGLPTGFGPSPTTFGAGGVLQPQPGVETQGTLGQRVAQAGVGGGIKAGSILAMLKELTSIGTKLPGVFGTESASFARSPAVEPAFQAQRAGEFAPELQNALALGFTGPEASALTGAFGPLSAADATALGGPGAGNVAQLQAMVNEGIFPGASTTLGAGGLGATGAADLAATGAADLAAISGGGLLEAGGVLGPAAELTGSELLGALSPVGGVLSLFSIADLFGAPGLGIGNIFTHQRANDLNAAQTEAALRSEGALARQGGPAEQLFLQRILDRILFQNIGQFNMEGGGLDVPATLALSGTPLPPSIGQRMMDIMQDPQGTLTPKDIDTFGALISPQDFRTLLGAIEGQRRLRTFAGLSTLAGPPPPSPESPIIPFTPDIAVGGF